VAGTQGDRDVSDTPHVYDDMARDGIRVVTHYDAVADRWTTTIIGGPMDGWSTVYRAEADPAVQHARVIAEAKG
jgi:hypothetical protein